MVWRGLVGGVTVAYRTGNREFAGSTLARRLPGNNSGQVLYTHNIVCLCSSSSIIWYRSKGGDALRLGRYTVGLASHWPCVTDSSGLSTYGLNGLRKGDEHPTYAPDGVWHFLLPLP